MNSTILTPEEEQICDTVDLYNASFLISAYEAALWKKNNTLNYNLEDAIKRIASDYKMTPNKVKELVALNEKHNFDSLLKKLSEVE